MGCLGRPLQQIAPGDQAAVADPGDGIQGNRSLVRQQRGVGGRPQQVVQQLRRGEVFQSLAGGSHGEGLGQGVKEQLHADHQRGDAAGPRGNEPGGDQQAPGSWRATGCGAGCRGSSSGSEGRAGWPRDRLKLAERAEKSTPRSASRRESSDGPGCCNSGNPVGIHRRVRCRWPARPGHGPLRSGHGSAPTLQGSVRTARG